MKKLNKLLKMLQEDKDYVTDYPKQETLEAIAEVESSGGKNLAHKKMMRGMHKGSSAIGKYGLMPSTIKETEKSLQDLSEEEIKRKMMRDEELEQRVASKYYDRLRKQLDSNDPGKIGYGWFQGITGAKKDIKKGKDIEKHFHVKKIRKAIED